MLEADIEDIEDTASVSSFSSSDDTIQSEHDDVYRFTKFKFLPIPPGSGVKPKPRSGHRIVNYNGKIYSFGGYNPGKIWFIYYRLVISNWISH